MPFSRDPTLTFGPEDLLGETLVGDLVEVVDELRDLYAQFGARDHRTFLVHTQWSGVRRGEGVQQVISETELLPSPEIVDLRTRQVTSCGSIEQGDLEASEISLIYTEDQLMGRGAGGAPIDPRREFFWELRTFDDDLDRRIRCTPTGPPIRQQQEMQWRMRLSVQRPSRGRDGSLP